VWSTWTPKFDSSVRNLHHEIWRSLLKLWLEHRPFNLKQNNEAHVKEMTVLSENHELDENDTRVEPVLPSWVTANALSASLRDPATKQAPTAHLMEIVLGSFANLSTDTAKPVEMLSTSVAKPAVSQFFCEKAKVPLDELLALCASILQRAPPYFSLLSPQVSHGEDAAAKKAFDFALWTINSLINCQKITAAECVKTAEVASSHYDTLKPTPQLLGINIEAPSLLRHVAPKESIKTMLDFWLSKSVWQQTCSQIVARLRNAIEKDKDITELLALLQICIDQQRRQVNVVASLVGTSEGGYAQVWPELISDVSLPQMKQLAYHLKNAAGCKIDDESQKGAAKNNALHSLFMGNATSVLKEELLSKIAFPSTVGDCLPDSKALTSAKPIKFTLPQVRAMRIRCQRCTPAMCAWVFCDDWWVLFLFLFLFLFLLQRRE
jgi:hypothetical protein